MVLWPLPCEFGRVCTSKVINEISVKFAWVFQYIIHLDVNSDVKCNFAGTIGWNYGNCPVNFGVWLSTSKVFNAKHWANVVTTTAERFSLISQSILNRFTCNFAHTIRSYCGDCPENLVRFDRVFQKLLMWLKQHCFHIARALMRAVIETALRNPSVHVSILNRIERVISTLHRHRPNIGFFFFFWDMIPSWK